MWAGAPALMARLESTTAETISDLKMSATVNPLVEAEIPTLVDVVEEGNEDIGLFQIARLVPNGDVLNEGWTTNTGATTNLHQAINESTTIWGDPARSPAAADWIQTTKPLTAYELAVDASAFAPGGSLENARIGWVAVEAIEGTNTGFRKMYTELNLAGLLSAPAGGALRNVYAAGDIYPTWWGEINPATQRPWTPADIAKFGPGGGYRIRFRSHQVSAAQFVRIWAVALHVRYIPVENRAAVAVWNRPVEIGSSPLVNVTTDDLRTMPAGTSDWSKLAGRNYLFYWRQSVSPSQYGSVVADDVRWNILHQDLGPVGQPPGVAFSPDGNIASRPIAHDNFGRPNEAFPTGAPASSIGAGAGLALVRSDAAISVDSQPYRFQVADMVSVTSAQKVGQRATPASSQSYIGVRLTIIPPATGNSILTVSVHRASDNLQMGGTFTITAAAARALPSTGGWRYASGFLSAPAALVGGTAYEIRLTATIGGTWVAAVPDCSLGNTASFGGSANGAFIGSTHFPNRELAVVLIKQPDPVTNLVAAIENVPVTSPTACSVSEVEHVRVSWTAPAVGLGAAFARYVVERQLEDETTWTRVRTITNPATLSWVDHQVPRRVSATYRLRVFAVDGRISNFATSNAITPQPTGAELIFTTNHRPDLEVVYDYDPQSAYRILAAERDEVVAIHGADYQVVFMESEDRGVGWETGILVNYGDECPPSLKGGKRIFDPLLALVRSTDVPYVCAMDHQGTRILGHVTPSEARQQQPFDVYTAQVAVVPTHVEDVPVDD